VSYAQAYAAARGGEGIQVGPDFRAIAMKWREGCISAAHSSSKIMAAYATDPEAQQPAAGRVFNDVLERCQDSWRRAVSQPC